MTDDIDEALQWIDAQETTMVQRITSWADINSGSYNTDGLRRQRDRLRETLSELGFEPETHSLPPHRVMNDDGEFVDRPVGDLIFASSQRDTNRSVMLGGHMDTVFGEDDPFQEVRRLDDETLHGPGVADDKGGLAMMLTVLECFETFGLSDGVGWELFMNPDEEIGSHSSSTLLHERAQKHDLGLIFEPAMPDGTMVNSRKGSGNFSIRVEGQSAHAGRNPDEGYDAIKHLSSLILEINEYGNNNPGIICNVGRVTGGGPVNVVPDRAVAHVNIRVDGDDDLERARAFMQELIDDADDKDGFSVTCHGGFISPPRPNSGPNRELFESIQRLGRRLNLDLQGTHSGGVTDGNQLWEAGLPNVDTLGPVGGNIHNRNEYLEIPSLTERSKLALLTLVSFVEGELLSGSGG